MKLITIINSLVKIAIPGGGNPDSSGSQAGYIIGGLIALLILGYLVYSLFKPEKF